jgi:hypothetical protein
MSRRCALAAFRRPDLDQRHQFDRCGKRLDDFARKRLQLVRHANKDVGGVDRLRVRRFERKRMRRGGGVDQKSRRADILHNGEDKGMDRFDRDNDFRRLRRCRSSRDTHNNQRNNQRSHLPARTEDPSHSPPRTFRIIDIL